MTPEELLASYLGEILVAGMPRYVKGTAPRGAIIKAPHLDSPYMDGLIQRGFQRPAIPRPAGPQLPSFL